MDRTEFVALLGPLLQAHRMSFDAGQWGVYHRALDDVPRVLLERVIERALKSGGPFLPKPGELRQFAEQIGRAHV